MTNTANDLSSSDPFQKSELSSTLLKAIVILDYLSTSNSPQALGEIARSTDLNQTVSHRLLATLKSKGLVIQDPASRGYALGWHLLKYGDHVLATFPIAKIIDPWLEKLRDLTRETTTLHIPSGNVRVCVLECESKEDLRRSVGVGRRVPIHLGASGRAIMAFLPEDERNLLISNLPHEEADRIIPMLEKTIKEGIAISHEESARNVAALAAPIFDRKGHILGALSISGPDFRWKQEEMVRFIPTLLNATEDIQSHL